MEAWSVSEATRYIKRLIENDTQLMEVWIRGELSNVKRHSRGHLYFTVKDANARMQSVMFAGYNQHLRFIPENGMKVLIRGEVNVYEPYGQYQFYAKEMQPDGIGSLHVAFERLKKQLEQEGLFAAERKKPLPSYPRHIAVITSQTGAVIRDIMTTLKRRMPNIRVTLFPVAVQGHLAIDSIERALVQANQAALFDLIIVGRGGGSMEELWAFNEERVARAIGSSTIPVISAVGHETDYTISDFVADLRAPTPTAAAEFAVPDVREQLRQVDHYKQRMVRAMRQMAEKKRAQLQYAKRSYAFRYPRQLVEQKEQQLDQAVERMNREMQRFAKEKRSSYTSIQHRLLRHHPETAAVLKKKELNVLDHRLGQALNKQVTVKRNQLTSLLAQLELLSPLKIMNRGYSLVYNEAENKLVKSVDELKENHDVRLLFKDGRATGVIKEIIHEGVDQSGQSKE
ncbi:exodeoxyribonuclease VII large subunit [Shouchella lehensis]|uniref:Exodeoxyribonuclease 7 large subunit n=2 Tax=Shouchella lehensis TaxID=300825 RepID=A0A060LZ26_9BACI|nr:exodeoxyribonuclease VII large subunit [Shouchella lehensis]AIC95020.1 exodeoxyribonuclease 7 large subunit [Shouchella lehensis G1]MBG9784140.1 exodeoxyribonuclease VII large subunit [Shouchella lehensis]TES50872.1 exodeoxyribonuclease VII large subunit [Shouchella lehensis]